MWNLANPWRRNVDNTDYWLAPSKKVCVMDWDATFRYNTPGTNNTGANDAAPMVGQGFWHAYQYIPEPTAPTDRTKYHVRCHAGFLDGHAAAIELNQYNSIDRMNHQYY
jgi:hypothetical protein